MQSGNRGAESGRSTEFGASAVTSALPFDWVIRRMHLPRTTDSNLVMPPMAPETDQDLLETERYEPTGPIDPYRSGYSLPDDDVSLARQGFGEPWPTAPVPEPDIWAWVLPLMLMILSTTLLASVLAVGWLVITSP